MKKLLKYDILFLTKTRKLLVFLAVFVLFSIMSPLTARYVQEILNYLLGDSANIIPIPDPTTLTSYQQYISDLYEIVFFVVLFVAVSIFMRDKNKGLTQLIFSKPINRTNYVISKYVTYIGLLFVSVLAGYLVFTYYTYFLFDEVYFTLGLQSMFLYWLHISFISAGALFAATHSKNYFMAILVTFSIYILFALLTVLGEVSVFAYLPGMLQSNIMHIITESVETSDVIITCVVTIFFIVLLNYAAIKKVNREDI